MFTISSAVIEHNFRSRTAQGLGWTDRLGLVGVAVEKAYRIILTMRSASSNKTLRTHYAATGIECDCALQGKNSAVCFTVASKWFQVAFHRHLSVKFICNNGNWINGPVDDYVECGVRCTICVERRRISRGEVVASCDNVSHLSSDFVGL